MIVWIYTLTFFVLSSIALSAHAEVFTVPSSQYKTITHALMKARSGDSVVVKPGKYREQIVINSGVTLISQEKYHAVIKGHGRGNTVSIVGSGRIIGFDIIRGISGVYTRGAGALIKMCRIYKNRGSGILCTGSLPIIEDCIIAFNEGSGIQAFSIVGGSMSISHNTIAYNANNGILISSSVPVKIENNIIAKNRAVAISSENNPELITISHNVLFDNHSKAFEMPQNNYSFNPLFQAPKKRSLDFSLQKDSPALNRGNNGEDVGARINNGKH